jgi:hypothetical protein
MAESKIRRQAADERFAGDSFDEGDEAAKGAADCPTRPGGDVRL